MQTSTSLKLFRRSVGAARPWESQAYRRSVGSLTAELMESEGTDFGNPET